MLALALLLSAPKVVAVPAGSADHKSMCALATIWINKNASFPCRVPGTTVRRYGDWAYLRSKIVPVRKSDQGDGEVIALFSKNQGKWRVIQISAGSDGLDEESTGWALKYKLPRSLVTIKR